MNPPNSHVAESMKDVLKTFKKQKNPIINALTYPYSNRKLERTNNLFRVIKRIAFGYRDFYNFRSRILLISNTMIHLEIKKTSSYFYDDGTDSKCVGLSHQHWIITSQKTTTWSGCFYITIIISALT
ncbi:transposase [Erysipelothrix aquatica]|uniref:transposase n=1 Tax=Erysipelothrix aquatica TaxID=2683714 RepID=UPI0013587E18